MTLFAARTKKPAATKRNRICPTRTLAAQSANPNASATAPTMVSVTLERVVKFDTPFGIWRAA